MMMSQWIICYMHNRSPLSPDTQESEQNCQIKIFLVARELLLYMLNICYSLNKSKKKDAMMR